jgi:VWFA-related protein
MTTRFLFALVLVASSFVGAIGQQPTPKPDPQQDDVVRISVTLVQVDAVVTDNRGQPVTDLKREDFELYEDGRKQPISNFSYVSTAQPAAPVTSTPRRPADRTAPPITATPVGPSDIRRTIAFVVDDLSLSFESTHFVREALRKFVDQQMRQGDLVAIIRTGAGMGALQQFTSDKRILYAAIERVRFNLRGKRMVGAFAPINGVGEGAALASMPGMRQPPDSGRGDAISQLNENVYAAGTLGALNFVVRGLRELPGRKSVVLVSDGLRIFSPGGSEWVLNSLRRLTDLANRASVVIYTMDARGPQPTHLTAADSTAFLNPTQIESRMRQRGRYYFESQEGLQYLSQQTGGFFIHNTNDLGGGVQRVLDDQSGYYLLGYVPESTTFKATPRGRLFHRLKVEVKRPGLRVRYRTGFYGISDDEMRPQLATAEMQVLNALTSPFTSGAVGIRLTSLFGNDPKEGTFVRSLLHINVRDLTFTDEADGWKKAVFTVVAITFGDNGLPVDRASGTFTLRSRGEEYTTLLNQGLVYTLDVPVKKGGAYQLRTAVRDVVSEKVGSANEFIEVPDIKNGRLTLSGIVLTGVDPSQSGDQKRPGAEGGADLASPLSAAVRAFPANSSMKYSFYVYNAKPDVATKKPQLESQIQVFRDGRSVYAGQVNPFSTGKQTDMDHIAAAGVLKLGPGLDPGRYTLQILMKDKLAKEKHQVTTQWIDFEVTK